MAPNVAARLPTLGDDDVNTGSYRPLPLLGAADRMENEPVRGMYAFNVWPRVAPRERDDPQPRLESVFEPRMLIPGEHEIASKRTPRQRRGLLHERGCIVGPGEREHAEGTCVRDRCRELRPAADRRLYERLLDAQQVTDGRSHRPTLFGPRIRTLLGTQPRCDSGPPQEPPKGSPARKGEGQQTREIERRWRCRGARDRQDGCAEKKPPRWHQPGPEADRREDEGPSCQSADQRVGSVRRVRRAATRRDLAQGQATDHTDRRRTQRKAATTETVHGRVRASIAEQCHACPPATRLAPRLSGRLIEDEYATVVRVACVRECHPRFSRGCETSPGGFRNRATAGRGGAR